LPGGREGLRQGDAARLPLVPAADMSTGGRAALGRRERGLSVTLRALLVTGSGPPHGMIQREEREWAGRRTTSRGYSGARRCSFGREATPCRARSTLAGSARWSPLTRPR